MCFDIVCSYGIVDSCGYVEILLLKGPGVYIRIHHLPCSLHRGWAHRHRDGPGDLFSQFQSRPGRKS